MGPSNHSKATAMGASGTTTGTAVVVTTASLAFLAGCAVGSYAQRRWSAQKDFLAQEQQQEAHTQHVTANEQQQVGDANGTAPKLNLNLAVDGKPASSYEPLPSARRGYHTVNSFPITPRLARAGSSDSLASAIDGAASRLKMVLVVRTDLEGMDGRKITVTASRLVLQLYKKLWQRKDPTIHAWDRGGKTIVCLRTPSGPPNGKAQNGDASAGAEEMSRLQQLAREKAVPTHRAKDPATGDVAVLALGPAEPDVLHELTSHLRLL